MGYESVAHETEGRMGYWLRAHEGERNNCQIYQYLFIIIIVCYYYYIYQVSLIVAL